MPGMLIPAWSDQSESSTWYCWQQADMEQLGAREEAVAAWVPRLGRPVDSVSAAVGRVVGARSGPMSSPLGLVTSE